MGGNCETIFSFFNRADKVNASFDGGVIQSQQITFLKLFFIEYLFVEFKKNSEKEYFFFLFSRLV